ncbi:hypothetical protein ABZP36_033405 [Zizania latifolia]
MPDDDDDDGELAAFWSGGTSTFVFPWGEVTVTLEDVAVLGAAVCARPRGTLAGDVDALEAVRTALYRTKNKKPTYALWVKHFLERPPEEEATTGHWMATATEKGRRSGCSSMQRFDQDVPGTVTSMNSNSKVVWATYKMEPEDVTFIVPEHEPGVTVKHTEWPRKRKIEGLLDVDSDKKRHLEARVPLPDSAEDPEDEIPLIERLNAIIRMMNKNVLKGTEPGKIAVIVKDLMPRWVWNGGKRAVYRQAPEQALSDAEAVLSTKVGESSCKDQHNFLQQNKDEASELVIKYGGKKSNSGHSGEVVLHHVASAASIIRNEAIKPAIPVDEKPTLQDIIVASDGEFDEASECEKGTIWHRK